MLDVIRIWGMKCDHCTWKDMSVQVKDYSNYLNKPCPVCGSNLLTEEDWILTRVLLWFNRLWKIFIISSVGLLLLWAFYNPIATVLLGIGAYWYNQKISPVHPLRQKTLSFDGTGSLAFLI